jgi:hypothetical protein
MSESKPVPATQPEPQRHKRARPIMELAGVSPIDREKVARWLDAHLPGTQQEVERLQWMMNTGQEFPGIAEQLGYKIVYLRVIKELSWQMRTARGGPLSGKKRFTRKQIEANTVPGQST